MYAPPVRRRFEQLHTATEILTADETIAYQWHQLHRVLRHAYDHVPYYRQVFEGLGAGPDDIRTPEDFRRLPLLSKHDLQEHGDLLLATNIPAGQRRYFSTSGSTGVPVGFYDDLHRSPAIERSFIALLRERVGKRKLDRVARFGGTVIDGLWEPRPRENTLLVSSYKLTDADLPAIVRKLHDFNPRFLEGYPSSIGRVADFILDHDLEPPVLGAVLCASENLPDSQRRRIGEAFGCRVFSHYGQSERVVLAGECEHSSALHVVPHYGYTEIVDGEIIGTGFWTDAMPLIRYQTGDTATFMDGFCPDCRRPHQRFERIDGRLQEFLVDGDGRQVSMAALNMHSPVFDNVRQFRFRQTKPGQVELRLVPRPAYSELDAARIRGALHPKLGNMTLELTLVDGIPAGPGGKHSFLEQRLPG